MMKPGINKAKGQSDQTGLDDKAKDKHSNAQNNNIPTTMDSPNPAGSAQPPSRARAFDPAGTEVHLASSSGYLGADEGTGTGTSTSGSGGQGVAMPSRRSFYAGYDALGRVERKDRMAGALRDLDSEINKIETHDKMAYQWAVDRCPKEARSKRRREAFLEREGLNSKVRMLVRQTFAHSFLFLLACLFCTVVPTHSNQPLTPLSPMFPPLPSSPPSALSVTGTSAMYSSALIGASSP